MLMTKKLLFVLLLLTGIGVVYVVNTKGRPNVQVEVKANASLPWLKERIISFPTDRCVGMLTTRKWDPNSRRPDEDFVEARGKVQVPAGHMLGLKFARNELVDLSPLANLKPTDLQNLYLYRRQVQDADLRHISHLAGLRQIELGMTKIGDEGLAHIAALKSLKELNIAQTKITDAGLIHLAKLSELETLSLMNTSITNKGLFHLRGLTNLKYLMLKNTRITGQGLFHLNKLNSLRTLNLSYTEIDSRGLLHLSDMPSLEWLILTMTPINDAAVRHIGAMKNLKGLNLEDTWITDTGIGYLKNLDRLEHLNLAGTKITDKGLGHLAGLSKLKYLNLKKTSLSKSALKTLKQALPSCKVLLREKSPNMGRIFAAAQRARISGNYSKAISILEEAVVKHGQEKAPGMHMPVKIMGRFSMAAIAKQSRAPSKAKEYYNLILNDVEGEEDYEYLALICNLYLSELTTEDSEALALLEKAKQMKRPLEEDWIEYWEFYSDWIAYEMIRRQYGASKADASLVGDSSRMGIAYYASVSLLDLAGLLGYPLSDYVVSDNTEPFGEVGLIDKSLALLAVGHMKLRAEKYEDAEKFFADLYNEGTYFSPVGGICQLHCKKKIDKNANVEELIEKMKKKYPGYTSVIKEQLNR